MHILGRNHASRQQLIDHELVEPLPIRASRRIDQYQRHHVALAGLQQCEHFERFVERPETTWEANYGLTFLHKHQFAGEEILHMNQLVVAINHRVGILFKREQDIQTHRLFTARADVTGFHDARGRSRDDHPALRGDRAAEIHRLLVGGRIWSGTRGPKDRHLRFAAKGGEDLQRVAQLAHRATEQLEIAPGRAFSFEAIGRLANALNQVAGTLSPRRGRLFRFWRRGVHDGRWGSWKKRETPLSCLSGAMDDIRTDRLDKSKF